MPESHRPPAPSGKDDAGRGPDRPGPASDAPPASDSPPASDEAQLHARDRAPAILLRAQAWVHGWFSNESRVFLGVVIVAVAVVSAIVVSSLRVVQVAFDSLDIFAVLTLFLVNWLGNGGVLVPIPGARFIGLLMVFQQAVILPSWEVFLVAGAAMGLGQLSYYVAGARTAESYAAGDQAGAEKIAADTGMSDDDAREFAPGAELDADIVSTLAGVNPSDSAGADSGSAVSPAAVGGDAPQRGWRARFSTSLKRTQDRARPVLEQRGAWGMFLLCFAPTPMGTAAAYLGGLMEFGFRRYLISSFGAKFLLTGVIVMLGLVFSDAARAVQLPEIELPQIDWPEFDFRLFELPDFAPDETPGSSPEAAATNAPSN
ncbi:MAG: hypothetical protein PVG27_04670 [Chloroflexota bacterium]